MDIIRYIKAREVIIIMYRYIRQAQVENKKKNDAKAVSQKMLKVV